MVNTKNNGIMQIFKLTTKQININPQTLLHKIFINEIHIF
ncbi:hypothetical protein C530_136 [Candidatus Portiera aleyrodidarum BT-B-HRs]|nr:hypothetical protein C530_136 [Candidatus Portiera aleyrodidarum BT-B-HRs]